MENVVLKGCPDCDELKKDADYITVHGRCFNCEARKRILTTKGKPYIKFKDLDAQEKEKLIKLRKYQQKTSNKKTIKKETNSNTILVKRARKTFYSEQFLNFVGTKPDLTRREIYSLAIKNFPEYADLTYKNFENVMSNHNFPSVDGRKAGRRNIIFTEDVRDFIRALCTEDMELKDIFFVVKNKFKDKEINDSNLRTYLLEHNIPYLTTKPLGPNMNPTVINNDMDNTLPPIPVPPIPVPIPVPTIEVEKSVPNKAEDVLEDDIQSRLQLAEEAVDKVLIRKYEEYKCNFSNPYTLDDITKALEVLLFLKEHKYTIFYTGKLKHKITDAYEKDLCHIMENNIMSKGDMSVVDRLHVLRNKRRNLEYQGKDLNLIQSFLKELNPDILRDSLKSVQQEKQNRLNEKYVPYVDDDMILEYDWCLAGKRQLPDFDNTHYNELEKIYDEIDENKIAEQSRSELSLVNGKKIQLPPKKFIYRVSCQVSGGGLGAFREWRKDIEAISEEEALEKGKHYIEMFCTENKGSIHSELKIIKLNR